MSHDHSLFVKIISKHYNNYFKAITMKIFKLKYFIPLFLFILITLTCNNNPVTPEEIKPGRRDYVWTVDTLNNLFNPRYRMWGSSPVNLWATSSGDWDNSISHFDGEKWSSYGVPGIIVPNGVFGFSSNNVFIGAENGKIWKFNGSYWGLFAELTMDGVDYFNFENIWGESQDNFYAVGNGPDENLYANHSVITHYNNNKWTMLNTDELKGDVVHLYKNKLDNKIYFRLTKIGGIEHIDSTIIYEYIQGRYERIYSSSETKGLQADISLINNQVYFILGNEIAKRVNNQFQTFFNVDNPNFYHRIWGRSSKDIFLLMTDGLAHFDGNNIEYVFHFTLANATPWTQIFGAALFKNEAFFLAYEPPTGLSLVYHGKLED